MQRLSINDSYVKFDFDDGEINIIMLEVARNERNQGIGSKLLSMVQEWGENNSATLISAYADPQDDETSLELLRNFYEKNGFSTVEGTDLYEKNI